MGRVASGGLLWLDPPECGGVGVRREQLRGDDLGGCGEETALPPGNSVTNIQSETESFTIRNPEIKQDIVTALIDSDIEHWTNGTDLLDSIRRMQNKLMP